MITEPARVGTTMNGFTSIGQEREGKYAVPVTEFGVSAPFAVGKKRKPWLAALRQQPQPAVLP